MSGFGHVHSVIAPVRPRHPPGSPAVSLTIRHIHAKPLIRFTTYTRSWVSVRGASAVRLQDQGGRDGTGRHRKRTATGQARSRIREPEPASPDVVGDDRSLLDRRLLVGGAGGLLLAVGLILLVELLPWPWRPANLRSRAILGGAAALVGLTVLTSNAGAPAGPDVTTRPSAETATAPPPDRTPKPPRPRTGHSRPASRLRRPEAPPAAHPAPRHTTGLPPVTPQAATTTSSIPTDRKPRGAATRHPPNPRRRIAVGDPEPGLHPRIQRESPARHRNDPPRGVRRLRDRLE